MPKTEVYIDEANEWRWRRKADNNEIIAVSSEGYKNKSDAIQSARSNFPDDLITSGVGIYPASDPSSEALADMEC